MTLMRFHLIYLIENTSVYVWHDSGNRGLQNAGDVDAERNECCLTINGKEVVNPVEGPAARQQNISTTGRSPDITLFNEERKEKK